MDLQPEVRAQLERQAIDIEKPGLGQHYCVECAKYFEVCCPEKIPVRHILTMNPEQTDIALNTHWKSKVHKRRCKALKEPAYTIEESERAAGLGRDTRRAVSKPQAIAGDISMTES